MGSGGLCEVCVSICYNGSTRKGEMRGGRSIYVMIDQRALEDFITFYIYSCLYTLDSDETRRANFPLIPKP